jgi:hypothetical protein
MGTRDSEAWQAYRRIRAAREAKERERDALGRTDLRLGHARHVDSQPANVRGAWRALDREAAALLAAEVSAYEKLQSDPEYLDELIDRLGRYSTCPQCGHEGSVTDLEDEGEAAGGRAFLVRIAHGDRPDPSNPNGVRVDPVVHQGTIILPTD